MNLIIAVTFGGDMTMLYTLFQPIKKKITLWGCLNFFLIYDKSLYLINKILRKHSAYIYKFIFLIFALWFQKQWRNITDLMKKSYFWSDFFFSIYPEDSDLEN